LAKIRLLIAEDETLVRHALAQLLDAEPDLEVVGQAPNGEAAVIAAQVQQPDVILMDINMPKLDGIVARAPARRPKSSMRSGWAKPRTTAASSTATSVTCWPATTSTPSGEPFPTIGTAACTAG